jgi:FkbM family methyltransferase
MNAVTTIAQLNLLPLWRRELKVWGCQMVAPSLDRLVCLALHRWGLMGKTDRTFYESQIKTGMTVVDVGANQGLYTLLFSRLVGSHGTVIAFEPEPDMFAALERNCRVNRTANIEAHRQAAGAGAGTAVLSRSLVHGGDNCLADRHVENLSRRVEVPVIPLDDVVRDRPVDFVKIDVQGWEMEVIRGMTGTLERNAALRIYFEYWPRGLELAGSAPLDVLAFLHERGFRVLADEGAREIAVSGFAQFREAIAGNRFVNLLAMR